MENVYQIKKKIVNFRKNLRKKEENRISLTNKYD